MQHIPFIIKSIVECKVECITTSNRIHVFKPIFLIMKLVLSLLTSLCFYVTLQAQVPKKIVVEHFTNTVCGICASRNPAFYANLSNQTDVLHIAIHPSSPYASCQLNQQNIAQNDARTNYYGVYGGTPRLVIQGSIVPTSSNYGSDAIFTPYENQTSPASLHIHPLRFGGDSIRVNVTLKTEAIHNLGNLRLFVALAEDTIFYSSPNGEDEHYDVFRRALTDPSGMPILLPTAVGDSVIYTTTTPLPSNWDLSRIYALAILQATDTKSVIQAESAYPADANTTTIQTPQPTWDIALSPNPARTDLTFSLPDNALPSIAKLYDTTGKLCATYSLNHTTTVSLPLLPQGIYWIKIDNEQGILTKKLFVY